MEPSQNGRGHPSSNEQPSSNRDPPPPPRNASSPQWDAPPPTTPPPVGVPPHMMYYPPPMGYHGGHGGQPYPPGYPPYPTEYPPHQPYNNYPHNPPPYYGQPETYEYQRSSSGRGFIRGFILCSCIMFAVFFIVTIAIALVLRPQLPKYKVVSLSVENFNTTTTLTGNWNTSVSVENPNDKLRGYFADFKVDLMYKRDEVSGVYAPGFELGKEEKRQIEVKAAILNVRNVDLDGMAKERASNGSVTLALRISSIAAFRSSSISTRTETVTAICEGLRVVFQNNSTSGTLDNKGNPIDCQLRA